MDWVEPTFSAISVPATKRCETCWPNADCSAKRRSRRFSDRWAKNALSTIYLPERKVNWGACRGRALGSQNFVSQPGWIEGDDGHRRRETFSRCITTRVVRIAKV